MDHLADAEVFSTIDLKAAYHQVPIAEEGRYKAAFTTPFGLFEPLWMMFGMSTSPFFLQRLMAQIFRDELLFILIVFFDDIIMWAKAILDHLDRRNLVFTRLRDHNLKVEPSKCSLLQPLVKFVDHQVLKKGVETDPDKVAAIVGWPVPKDSAEHLTFVCKIGYYRCYVEKFSQRAAPLYRLVNIDPNKGKKRKRGKKWIKLPKPLFEWDESCQKSFEDLKNALVTASVIQTSPSLSSWKPVQVTMGWELYYPRNKMEKCE